MKKKNRVIYLVYILIFIAFAIYLYVNNKEVEYLENPNLSMEISNLSRSGASITIRDNANEGYAYSGNYDLEKYENDTWISLEVTKEESLEETTYYINEDTKTLELDISWGNLYGLLSNGKYRIVMYAKDNKNKLNYVFYKEFTIDDNTKDKI